MVTEFNSGAFEVLIAADEKLLGIQIFLLIQCKIFLQILFPVNVQPPPPPPTSSFLFFGGVYFKDQVDGFLKLQMNHKRIRQEEMKIYGCFFNYTLVHNSEMKRAKQTGKSIRSNPIFTIFFSEEESNLNKKGKPKKIDYSRWEIPSLYIKSI